MSNDKASNKNSEKKVVLAFSGGLDTSFCVPYLIEQGYQVTTVFVDSGGVNTEEKNTIKQRALELGANEHLEVSIAEQLWEEIVTPLIYSGHWYQNQYPLLCSDRYLIVEACLKICDKLQTKNFAHGCTGMGNDQVRFDLAVNCLGDYNIISPIREIQKLTSLVRDYEKNYLIQKGFSVSNKVSSYSINENLLGTTISGSEIDLWKSPEQSSYVLTSQPCSVNNEPQQITLTFKQGKLTHLNQKVLGAEITGESVMQSLNSLGGDYSIGRGIYTGDTTIGLKGRIVFESPALHLLNMAHTALEQCVLSKAQNRFKSTIAQKWTELVYEGLFYDPLKTDLEAFLVSSQSQVTGKVTLLLTQGNALAVEVQSENILNNKDAVYAQSAAWSVEEALGFIKLFGQSSTLANNIVRKNNKSTQESL